MSTTAALNVSATSDFDKHVAELKKRLPSAEFSVVIERPFVVTNYSQSRYLCFYLQEKGLLVKFYKQFVKDQGSDPTGFKTLQKTLGVADMEKFKKDWEKLVVELTEPVVLLSSASPR